MGITKHIYISGKVQNVGFRQFTYNRAKELLLNGWVKNLDDGRVEVVVQGEENVVRDFIRELKEGPRFARVADAEITDVEEERLSGFQVRYD